MWVITRDGFISVVRHRDIEGAMLVRARRREDLERPFGHLGLVEEDGAADYRFRMVVPVEDLESFLVSSVEEIDYDTHAKEAMAGGDTQRYRAYLTVWSALYRLQDNTTRVTTDSPNLDYA